MPTGKIKGYRFYFHVGEILEKHKPIHIHVRASQGKIQFGLKLAKRSHRDTKEKLQITVKKIQGHVNEHEQNQIKKIIHENLSLFFQAGERKGN